MLKLRNIGATALAFAMAIGSSWAGEVQITVNKITADGVGPSIGTIMLKDSRHGMMVVPKLHDLPPGNHAFHIHQNPSCEPGTKNGKSVAGLQAGGHYDPTGVGHSMKHGHGAKHDGRMKPHGDLPQLVAATDGTSTAPVVTSKLSVSQAKNRAIMIHRFGEGDPGAPKGGGPRYACGVIPK